MTGMVYNILKSPKELKPHKTNTQIYGTEIVDADLVESIKNKGILEPIVILEDNTILSGHRRWLAAKELKLERVPCRSMSFSDELDEKEALIEFNRQRKKNTTQRMNEKDLIKYIEQKRNEIRQKELAGTRPNIRNDLPMMSEEGIVDKSASIIKKSDKETTSILAKKVGISRDKFIKEEKVWESAKSGDKYAKSLIEKMDKEEVSTNEAANRIKVYQEAPEPVKKLIIEKDMTAKEAIKEIKKEERIEQKKIQQQTPTKDLPDSDYEIIYADPPWRYDFSATENREIENQYPTMDIEDICNLKVPAAKDCVLFLWGTAPKLKEALKVIDSWGFEYKTHAIWDKKKIGMGYYFRGQHELLLIGTKGSPGTPLPADRPSSIISITRTEHSKKPELVSELIEKMYPSKRYLEMFARNKRDNWTSWGNEL